jgi:hypothetical protein
MSNGNKEILLMVRNPQGSWTVFEDPEAKGVARKPKEFRTEAAAQREGSILLRDQHIDAYKVFKLMSEHH